MQIGHSFNMVGRATGAALAALLACSAAGCISLWHKRAPAATETPLLLVEAKLDKEVYARGEAVVCTIQVTNETKKPMQVGLLGTETLEFWYGPVGTELRFKRIPVRSSKEKACETVKLGPKEKAHRDFVLVDLTAEEGINAIHAFYRPTCDKQEGIPYYIAPAVAYKVDGPVVLRRDSNGVIVKDQAVSLAKEWFDRPVSRVDAVLVRNEAGFLDWWVTLDVDAKEDPASDLPRRALLINAHTGTLRAEARPRPLVAGISGR